MFSDSSLLVYAFYYDNVLVSTGWIGILRSQDSLSGIVSYLQVPRCQFSLSKDYACINRSELVSTGQVWISVAAAALFRFSAVANGFPLRILLPANIGDQGRIEGGGHKKHLLPPRC